MITISILIPSFNQAGFLKRNLEIMRTQVDEYTEVLIADGGSSDESCDVIKQFDSMITWWVSEKDGGQSHALNKALKEATGEWIGWQNSDDCYTDGALAQFRAQLAADKGRNTEADVYYSHANIIDEDDRLIFKKFYCPFNIDELKFLGYNCTNQAMFIRRSVLEKVGGWDGSYHFAMDADLWFRLHAGGARFKLVNTVWGAFRVQSESKSATMNLRKSDEWTRLGLREFPAHAHLHPYCGHLHRRRIWYMFLRQVYLLRSGNWMSWLRHKWSGRY